MLLHMMFQKSWNEITIFGSLIKMVLIAGSSIVNVVVFITLGTTLHCGFKILRSAGA